MLSQPEIKFWGGGTLNNKEIDPELKRFNKNKKQKQIILSSIIGILLVVGSIILYRTYAFFEEKKIFNIIQGQVPNHWYDMDIISVVVDGEEKNSAPARGLYKVTADCGDTTIGEWDYNAWGLLVNNLSENTRCNVTFTSNGLTQAEYDEYIEAGIALRRNTYRGKDISSYLTATGDMNLYTQISTGRFNDIYVGDVIKAGGKDWLVADIDNYLYTGDEKLTKHHLTIIPAFPFANSGMNETATTEGGYYNSAMVQGTKGENVTYTLVDALATVENAFGTSHIIEYRNLLTNEIRETQSITIKDNDNRDLTIELPLAVAGYSHWTGASSNWLWYTRKIDLMSEINVFGVNVWSSSGYDTGIDDQQYAIFQLKTDFKDSYKSVAFNYWLKNITNKVTFVHATGRGNAEPANFAYREFGVRPRFLLGQN